MYGSLFVWWGISLRATTLQTLEPHCTPYSYVRVAHQAAAAPESHRSSFSLARGRTHARTHAQRRRRRFSSAVVLIRDSAAAEKVLPP